MGVEGLVRTRTWHYLSSTGTSVICLFLGMLSGIITARFLGPVGRGELAVLAYFPTIISTFFTLGLPEAAGFLVNDRGKEREDVIAISIQIAVSIGIIGSIVIALFSIFWLGEENRYLQGAVIISCLCSPAMAINATIYCLLRNIEKINRVNISLLLVTAGYIVVLLILYFLEVVSAVAFNLSALAIQTIIMLGNLYHLRGAEFHRLRSWDEYTTCLRQAFRFFLPAVAMMFFALADRALLLNYATLKQIGYYVIALSIVQPLSLSIEAFAHLGFVEVAESIDRKRKLFIAASRFRVAQIIMLISACALVPIIWPLVEYGFGEEFLSVLEVCYWLIPVIAIKAMGRVLDFILRAMGHILPGTIAGVVGLACLIGTSSMLYKRTGAVEVSIIVFLGYFAYLISLLVSVSILTELRLSQLWGIRPSTCKEVMGKLRQLGIFIGLHG